MAQADVDQLIARTTNGPVLLSGAAQRIEVQTQHGEVVAREPISVTESFGANTVDGNIAVDFRNAAPARSRPSAAPAMWWSGFPAAAQLTARSDDGDVVVESLR